MCYTSLLYEVKMDRDLRLETMITRYKETGNMALVGREVGMTRAGVHAALRSNGVGKIRPQRVEKVKSPPKKMGRKVMPGGPTRIRSFTLSNEDIAKLTDIGGGNASKGVRTLLSAIK